jgi:hypothetical protein
MKKRHGRPERLLARCKGETREEIINTIVYGTPAWRIIRLRHLIGDKRGLPPNYLSQGLRAIEAQVQDRAQAAQNVKALDLLWNELRAKNEGKPPARREWLKERNKLLKQLRANDSRVTPSKEWIQAACLWRELSMQIESALVIGDDDWLNELAKAIRGEASPEQSAQFTSKVLVLLQRKAGATASDIFADEALKKKYLDKLPDGRADVPGRVKVEDHQFANKQRVLDAIHDIATKVSHEWKRIGNP